MGALLALGLLCPLTTRRRPTRTPPRRSGRPPGGRPGGRRAATGTLTRLRRGLAAVVGRQSDDVWGVVFLAVAAIAALGIYLDLTGPAGRALRDGAGDLFGWGRLLVPPCLALVGGDAGPGPAAPGAGTGGAGLRISAGRPSAACSTWREAPGSTGTAPSGRSPTPGGLLGAVVGGPLRDLLAPWGAAIILFTLWPCRCWC